ncbi:glycosyltransferase family 4 protein [Flavihumibacter profundi]|jgi:glycosyltransferase involved in cell wall biosynthesis|uniref:glycosyltransferase family 4 protein n=1 Tax=Flavihumibacter profundi TaxID=2716883 RepID=UPI001CC78D56|nr:glycosyltransferase family 4 protein [Flavihumibacter profundi]MBZ5855646.1 glycosyltransferase family 4 protein [Flavihumibacter profundi]
MRASPLNLIAFVSNNSWSVYNFRLDIIRYLQSQGFSIMVIAPTDDFSKLLTSEGCLHVPVSFNNRSANPVSDFRLYRRLKKIYIQYKPKLIFHFVAKPNIYGTLAAGSLGIPSVAVITGLGYAFDRQNWLLFIVKGLYKLGLRKAIETWFLNADDATFFVQEKLVLPEKVKILPGEGVDTKYFKRSAIAEKKTGGNFIFIMSCRMLKSKGVCVYAQAARILRQKGYRFECHLMGAFEEAHPDSIAKEELDGWVKSGLIRYLGFAKDVRPYLQGADCCLLPSFYHEGVPRSLMEAASMELPVITTRNTGCKELVLENISGYLCEQRNAEDLAEKMEKVMRLPVAGRMEMGYHGRQLMINKFDVSHVIKFYASVVAAQF